MGEILNNVRAQVLVDALPYIQKYNNKILVVKYGGNAMTNKELKQAVMDDIVLLSLVGVKVGAGARRRSGDQRHAEAAEHRVQVYRRSAVYR